MIPAWSVATQKNTRGLGKPNEDFYLVEESLPFFLVLDGVSRPSEEYPVTEEESIVCRLNRLLGKEILRTLKASPEKPPRERLTEALKAGNRALPTLWEGKTKEEWGFYPAAVGIAALVENRRFCFAYAGDCMGVLLRENCAIYFGEQKSVRYAELKIPSRIPRYESLCNRPRDPFAHGAFNGEEALGEMIRYGSFPLEEKDVILLSTDGAGRFLQWASPERLASLTPREILKESEALDEAPFAKYGDDKTILRLAF